MRISRLGIVAFIILAASWLTTSCESPHAPAARNESATSRPSIPTDVARVGTPFRVIEAQSSAEVTITKILYPSTSPSGQPSNAGEFAVLYVRIVGSSKQRFHYSGMNFFFQYTQQPDPYQPQDSNFYGVDPTDWDAFPPQLAIGFVANGQAVQGTVPLEVSSKSLLLISMTNNTSKTLVKWLATSA